MLINRKVITFEEQELYEYAFFMILSYLFFFLVSSLIGLVAGIALETILFFITFSLTRNYTGGIHAKTENRCMFFTLISISASISLLKVIIILECFTMSKFIMVFSVLCLLLIRPIDNESKELSKSEKSYNHKIVIVISIVFMALYAVLFFCGKKAMATSLSVGITLAAILLLIGKLKELKMNCKEKSAN